MHPIVLTVGLGAFVAVSVLYIFGKEPKEKRWLALAHYLVLSLCILGATFIASIVVNRMSA